jgi:hypothetical protein
LSQLLSEIKAIIKSEGGDADNLQKETIGFINDCKNIADKSYGVLSFRSRQVKTVIASTALAFDGLIKEINAVKDDITNVKDSIQKGN